MQESSWNRASVHPPENTRGDASRRHSASALEQLHKHPQHLKSTTWEEKSSVTILHPEPTAQNDLQSYLGVVDHHGMQRTGEHKDDENAHGSLGRLTSHDAEMD